MEQLQVIVDFWRMAIRRLPMIVVVTSLGLLITGFLIYILPQKYQAQARILVERQHIPSNLARSTVTSDVAERLQQIQSRLLARENIIRMINDHGLFSDRPDLSLNEKINHVRWAIQFKSIEVPRVSRAQRNVDVAAFDIRVVYSKPRTAARVANELVAQVQTLNLANRTELATETLNYFSREEERLEDALAAVEAEITQFKQDNDERLPESLDYRRFELSRMADNVLDIDKQVLELQGQRSALAAELNEIGKVAPPPQTPEETELRRLEALLVQKQTVFSEDHHEIRALRAQIAAIRNTLPPTFATAPAVDTSLLHDRIALIETSIAALGDKKVSLEMRRLAIEASIAETPKVEMRLNALARNQKELQNQYISIVAKRAEAKTGERLEVSQHAERFEVIENALVPEKPFSPDRKKIVMMGTVSSLGLAFGLAFFLDLLRPVIRTPSQMERWLELKPVAVIPYISTDRERIRARLKTTFWILFLGGTILGALYLIDQHVMPLALIAEKTGLERLMQLIDQRF